MRENLRAYLDLVDRNPGAFRNLQNPNEGITIVTDPEGIACVEESMRAKLLEKGQDPSWAEVGVVYCDQYLCIVRDAVLFQPGNHPGTYIRQFGTTGAAGVVILPVYEGKVCLLRLFRHSTRDWALEIPRGFGERGLSPEQNARRELAEEWGGTVAELHELGCMDENTGLGDARTRMYLARLESLDPPASEGHEGIQSRMLVPVDAFYRMIQTGEVHDSFTLCATLHARLQGLL